VATYSDRAILDAQISYYRARAAEYDEWFLRQGRYDRGPAHRADWLREVEQIQSALAPEIPRGSVLELACGTGLWTQRLAERASLIVAVDASPETLAINAERVHSDKVQYVLADIFSWTSADTFDLIFFSFWLSHVPESRFAEFWERVRTFLKPDGRIFFVDSLLEQTHAAIDHGPLDRSGVVRRRLNDGREFEIVKVFHEPADLERRLHDLGWRGHVHSSGRFFLHGSMARLPG
jgi:demethylmenaquinone methyltransferase/2-methoxy-6-polyprenyl-1,4-benzoquinol methylase